MAARVPRYNPAFLSEEDLIAGFVVRAEDLRWVVEAVRENKAASNQHLLVVGPRGMGKTSLVRRAVAEIRRDPKLSARWTPIVFGEEAYEVSTPAELWLEAIYYLGQQTADPKHQAAYESLKPEREEKRLYDRALGHLLDYADRAKKRLLVVVENLNMVLSEQLKPDDAWVLRQTLQTEPRIMLLATAPTRFDEIDQPDQAMYELFRVHELPPLDKDECRTLWKGITNQELPGDEIRPIQILTGGNPRLVAILGSFSERGSLRYLMDDFNALVDEHTAYFKTNLEALPPPERKVFAVLADIWKPATAREVADAARFELNATSTYLQRLVQRGAVSPAGQVGRAKRYQIAERLYNIYHLMRRSGEPSQKVRAVVDFMIGFYQSERLVDVVHRMMEEACKLAPDERRDHLLVFEALLDEIPSLKAARRLARQTKRHIQELPEVTDRLKRKVSRAADATTEVALERRLRAATRKHPHDFETWLALGRHLVSQSDALSEAEDALKRAAALRPRNREPWDLLLSMTTLHIDRNRQEDALRIAVDAEPMVAAWPDLLAMFRCCQAVLLFSRGEERTRVESLLRGAIREVKSDSRIGASIDRLYATALYLWRDPAALEWYLKIQDAGMAAATDWERSAELLAKAGRFQEAAQSARRALSLDPDSWLAAMVLVHASSALNVPRAEFLDELRAVVERSSPTSDVRPLATLMVAGALWLSGAKEDALRWTEDSIDRRPDEPLVIWARAVALLWSARAEEALPLVRTGLKLPAPDSTTIVSVVLGLTALGHWSSIRDALATGPHATKLWALRVALDEDGGEVSDKPQELVQVVADVKERLILLRKLHAKGETFVMLPAIGVDAASRDPQTSDGGAPLLPR